MGDTAPFRPPKQGGLGEAVYNTLASGLFDAATNAANAVGTFLRTGIDNLLEFVEAPLRQVARPYLTMIATSEYLPGDLRAQARQMLDEPHPAHVIGFVAIAGAALMGIVMGMVAPLQRQGSYSIDMAVRSNRLTPADAIMAARLGWLSSADSRRILQELGYPDNHILTMEQLSYSPVGYADIRDAYLRGEKDRQWVVRQMVRGGITEGDANQIIANWQLIPGYADLVRMAVREAFDDSQAAKLDLDADFPADFARWAQKQGLGPEWARRYWRAHWELPSPTQAYEMLHRGQIDESELADLLRAADYAPKWRGKLAAISYNPFTRVDIRRMYDQGVLVVDEVKRAYQDAGYNEWSATKLAEWTIMDKKAASKELVKSEIISAYTRKIFTRPDTAVRLSGLGYDDDDIQFLLDIADYKEAQAEQDELEGVIKEQYLSGFLDDNQLAGKLTELQLPSARQERLALQWRRQRAQKPKRPGVDQLQSWALKGLIDEQSFRFELSSQGWGEGYIDLYWQEVFPQRSPSQLMSLWKERAIDSAEFTREMQSLGYTQTQIDDYLEALEPELSLADWRALLRKGLVNQGEFTQELLSRGFTATAIKQYITLAAPAAPKTTTAKPKRLTLAQMQTLVGLGQMTERQYREELKEANYNDEDTERLVGIMKAKLEKAQGGK